MSLLSKADTILYEIWKKDNNLREDFDLCFIPNSNNFKEIDIVNKNIYDFALLLSATYKLGKVEKYLIKDLSQFNKIILDVYSIR